jgi:hypothetical protein
MTNPLFSIIYDNLSANVDKSLSGLRSKTIIDYNTRHTTYLHMRTLMSAVRLSDLITSTLHEEFYNAQYRQITG